MTNLTPRAAKAWEAFNQEEPGVFVDYGDCLANAFRAAAAHLLREKGWSLGVRWSAEELQSIARELEGQP
jgi:hypothetical protein